jgi:hypothetical protein
MKRIEKQACSSALVRTGGRLIKNAAYYSLILAEGHLHRRLFGGMPGRIVALAMLSG